MGEKVTEKEPVSLEEMFQNLEGILSDLERDDISLEDSFSLYHKGMNLLMECSETIDTVEKKIKVLDDEGKEQDF